MVLEKICPRYIRYTQNTVSEVFGSPSDTIETLERTFRQLLCGSIKIETLPLLQVVLFNGVYWVQDGNRRLYVYKKLHEYGQLERVAVDLLRFNMCKFINNMTTRSYGDSVIIRQDARQTRDNTLSERLDRLYHKWQQSLLHPPPAGRPDPHQGARRFLLAKLPPHEISARCARLARAKIVPQRLWSKPLISFKRQAEEGGEYPGFATIDEELGGGVVEITEASELALPQQPPYSVESNQSIDHDVTATSSMLSSLSSAGGATAEFDAISQRAFANSAENDPLSTRALYGRLALPNLEELPKTPSPRRPMSPRAGEGQLDQSAQRGYANGAESSTCQTRAPYGRLGLPNLEELSRTPSPRRANPQAGDEMLTSRSSASDVTLKNDDDSPDTTPRARWGRGDAAFAGYEERFCSSDWLQQNVGGAEDPAACVVS